MLAKPAESYADDLYHFGWPDEGIEMVVERFSEVRDSDIACELTVRSDHPTKGGTLADGKRLLLVGPNSLRDMTRYLETRDDQPDWHGMLEQVTTLARRRYRRGEPPTDLRTPLEQESRYLVRPLVIDAGTTVWFGNEESAKSMLSMIVAVAVASGKEVAGLVSELTGPVVIFDWEDAADTHKERLRAICKGAGLNLETVPIWHQRMSASLHESSREMRRLIAELGAVFAIVDSIGMASGGDPADANGIVKVMIGTRSLGIATLGIHHLPKDAKDKSRPYGSVYAAAEARMTWLVEKDEDAQKIGTLRIALTNKKSNRSGRHPRQSFEFRFMTGEDREMLEEVAVSPIGFMESATIGTGAGQKWRIVAALDVPQTIDTLSIKLGITKAVLRTQLNRHKDLFKKGDGDLWGRLVQGSETESETVPVTGRNSVPGRNETGGGSLEPRVAGVMGEEKERYPLGATHHTSEDEERNAYEFDPELERMLDIAASMDPEQKRSKTKGPTEKMYTEDEESPFHHERSFEGAEWKEQWA